MSIKRLTSIDLRGDTIVEVVIVLAILGMAISICYATANRSLLDARQAQEASEAAEVVQTQVETLRTMSSNPQFDGVGNPNPNFIFPPATQPFCVRGSGAMAVIVYPAASPNPCNFNTWYDVTINYTPIAGATGGTFTVVATWDDAEGQGQDTDTLVYNLYQVLP